MNKKLQINKLVTVSVLLLSLITFRSTAQVAQWNFDGNGYDVFGTHNLTLQGSPEFVSGKYGQAISFNGTSQYAEDLVSYNITDYPLSIAAWVKTSATSSQTVCMFNSPTTTVDAVGLQITSTGGTITAFSRQGSNQYTPHGTISVADGSWHHLAVVYNSVTSVDLYVDGSLDVSSIQVKPFPTNYKKVTIGRYEKGGSPQTYFIGAIDDVRIYTTALTASEINTIYAGTTTAIAETGVEKSMKIYPNTVSGDPINIELAIASASNVTLFDVSGSKIFETNAHSQFISIPGANLKSGIYFIRVVVDSQTICKKIMVK